VEEGGAPSFSRLVLHRTCTNIWEFLKSIKRDIAIAVISLGVGFSLYWHYNGLPVAMEQATSVVAFTLAPLGFVALVVILWHVFLAPFELIYQSNGMEIGKENPHPQTINWEIWKRRSQYKLIELAAILAKTDPTKMKLSSDGNAILELLMDEIRSGKVHHVSRLGVRFNSYLDSLSFDDRIERGVALSWAKENSFDVEHLS
jgi:hypothetical protein